MAKSGALGGTSLRAAPARSEHDKKNSATILANGSTKDVDNVLSMSHFSDIG
jgi:hypothetical protein